VKTRPRTKFNITGL